MAFPLLNQTQLERIDFQLSESAPPPVKRERRLKILGETTEEARQVGTWRGRIGKTAQDRIKPVSARPRYQAWASRIDTQKGITGGTE